MAVDTTTPVEFGPLRDPGGSGGAIYNVRHRTHGATGDGSTSDTTAVQAAIDACEADGGGTVYFPPGTYMVAGLTVADNVRLCGAGKSSVLKMIASTNQNTGIVKNSDETAGNSGIAIENLAFDGNRTNQTITGDGAQIAVWFVGATQFSLRNLWIKDMGTDGLYFGRANTDASPVLSANGTIVSVFVTNSRRNNCSVTGAEDLDFFGCDFDAASGVSPQSGVDIESNASTVATRRIRFHGCRARDNVKNGFMLANNQQADAAGVAFIGCNAESNSGYGFSILGENATHVRLSDNDSHANGDSGYLLDNMSGGAVIGNTAEDNTGDGFELLSVSSKVLFVGNTAERNGAHGFSFGRDFGGEPGHAIVGCMAYDNSQTTGGASDGFFFQSDSASHLLQAITLSGCVASDRQGTSTQQYGIHLGTNCGNMIAVGCVMQGNATAAIQEDSGKILTVGNVGMANAKLLSGSTTWAPGTVTADTYVTTNVTVTGAALGDPVSLGHGGVIAAGMILVGQVTAADTVTVTLFNHRSTDTAVNSATLTALVWKQ